MTAKFRWLTSNYSFGKPRQTFGPWYADQQKIVPSAEYHDLDDLLKIPYSDTIKKRLEQAKPGTAVRIQNVSRGSDLYVQRLTDDEIVLIDEIEQSETAAKSIDDQIKTTVPILIEDLRKERNKLAKLKKKYDKIVEGIRLE